MQKLLKDIERLRRNWNEVSSFTLKGVRNLSPSDLDTLELYAQRNGQGLMKPLGDIAVVLEKYGYVHQDPYGMGGF